MCHSIISGRTGYIHRFLCCFFYSDMLQNLSSNDSRIFFFLFNFIFILDGVQTTHAFWAKVYLCSQSFSFPPATTGISETCSLNLCNSSSVFLVLIVEPEVSHISFFKMERGNPEYCVRHKCFKVSRFLFSLMCFKCLFAFFTFVITNEWHLLIRYFS